LKRIKYANQDYYIEVSDIIVDNPSLEVSISTLNLFYGGSIRDTHGMLITVYIESIRIIGNSVLVASIASQFDDQFKAAGNVALPNIIQYLQMSVI